jgi:hypothetical protein
MGFTLRTAAALVFAPWMAANAQPRYEIVDLAKAAGAAFADAFDVNNQGWVSGSTVLGGTQQATIWRSGGIERLGILPGYFFSKANALNETGYAAGYSAPDLNGPPAPARATLFTPSGPLDLGFFGQAFGINDSLQIVGISNIGVPMLWDNGVLSTLPYESNGIPRDINQSGTIVGSIGTFEQTRHAAKWVDGKLIDIHPTNAAHSEALAVNDGGDIAGYINSFNHPTGPVVWKRDGTIIELGDFKGGVIGGGRATDIDNFGRVVGRAADTTGDQGFLWEKGLMTRLRDLIPAWAGWEFNAGIPAIGDGGHIAGYAYHHGQLAAYLMMPVPEPATFLSLAGLMAAFFLCSKKR